MMKHTWHNTCLDVALFKILHLLTTSPKHKRVSTLEPENAGTFHGKVAKQLVDFILGSSMEPFLLAHIHQPCTIMHQAQDLGGNQPASGLSIRIERYKFATF